MTLLETALSEAIGSQHTGHHVTARAFRTGTPVRDNATTTKETHWEWVCDCGAGGVLHESVVLEHLARLAHRTPESPTVAKGKINV